MPRSTRPTIILALTVVVAGAACDLKGGGGSTSATADDTAKAKKSCAKYPDYVAADGPAVLAKLDARCAGTPGQCPWRKNIAEICSFYGPKTSQRYDVITTLSTSDEASRDSLCDALRDNVVALSTRVDIFCKGGKTCTKCGVRAGGR